MTRPDGSQTNDSPANVIDGSAPTRLASAVKYPF